MSKKLEEYTKEELLAYIAKLKKDIKFGLVWNPKDEQVATDCETKVPVLQEVADKTITKATDNEPVHLLLEGDNYHSLSVLNYTHAGEVDVIYIDPPYNTGNKDFIYNDRYVDKEDPYRHSEWLSFMDNRLRLAKNLLADTGVIFISIDDNEHAHLKILCDTIFGEENFVTTIHVEMSTTQGMKVKSAQNGNIVKNAEYILAYSKNGKKNIAKRLLYDNRPDYDTHYNKILNTDNTTTNLKDAFLGEYPDEEFTNLQDMYIRSKPFKKFIEENVDRIFADDKITGLDMADFKVGVVTKINREGKTFHVINNGKKMRQLLFLKASYGEADDLKRSHGLRKIRGDWWGGFYLDMGNVSKEGDTVFENGKKPIRLIRQLIEMASNKDSVILDFFAGSGTTGHAVLQLNANDGGRRQFILGTDRGKADVGGVNIAEDITYVRINKVINGYNSTAGIPANLRYYKTDFVDTSGLSTLTDKDKLDITKEMGAMIALRENSFDQVEQTDHWQTYENATQLTAIYYREDKTRIQEYLDKLNAQDKPVKLYVFGWGKNAGSEYASKKISVEDIPEPLIEVYKEIAK